MTTPAAPAPQPRVNWRALPVTFTGTPNPAALDILRATLRDDLSARPMTEREPVSTEAHHAEAA